MTTYIFTSQLSNEDKYTNNILITELYLHLITLKIPFKPVLGVYRGESENSVVTTVMTDELESLIFQKYKQACYLKIDDRNQTWLVYGYGAEYFIGRWKGSRVKPHGDYTQDGEHYYYAI